VLLLIYMDDIIVTTSDNSLIIFYINNLNSQFIIKDLGPSSYFLGIKLSSIMMVSDYLKRSTSKKI
jgi:hypothetical protein